MLSLIQKIYVNIRNLYHQISIQTILRIDKKILSEKMIQLLHIMNPLILGKVTCN